MCVELFCSHKIDYNPIWITFRNKSSVSQSVVHEIDNKVPVVLLVRYIHRRYGNSSGSTSTSTVLMAAYVRSYCTRVNTNIRKYDRRLLF